MLIIIETCTASCHNYTTIRTCAYYIRFSTSTSEFPNFPRYICYIHTPSTRLCDFIIQRLMQF